MGLPGEIFCGLADGFRWAQPILRGLTVVQSSKSRILEALSHMSTGFWKPHHVLLESISPLCQGLKSPDLGKFPYL